jgi:hypothetical protein
MLRLLLSSNVVPGSVTLERLNGGWLVSEYGHSLYLYSSDFTKSGI